MSHSPSEARLLAPVLMGVLAACGNNLPPASPTTATDGGHDLALLTTACWFGGTWSDYSLPEQNCAAVIKRVYGPNDKTHLEPLRACDEAAVADVTAKVAADAKDAPRRDELVAFVQSFAAAQRELMSARRSADRLKRDLRQLESEPEKEKLTADEASVIAPLKNVAALSALLSLDAGVLTADAHALGIMTAVERISLAYTLPKHMKVFAGGGPMALLFGVGPPLVSEEVDRPLPPGVWVSYVDAVAKAAGHPVDDTVKVPADRLGFGWSGIYQGLAEKLRAEEGQLSEKALAPIVKRTAIRFENDARALQAEHRSAAGAPPWSWGRRLGAKPTVVPAKSVGLKK